MTIVAAVSKRDGLLEKARTFYKEHSHRIKESHGIRHWERVHEHACKAIESLDQRLSEKRILEIEAAALLHDVDDEKYFPKTTMEKSTTKDTQYYQTLYPNALALLFAAEIPTSSHENILFMIDNVSCSKNGNQVPRKVQESQAYEWLIPRWSDRIEAVGPIGVWRCYQYNQEKQRPLHLEGITPRPQTEEELWNTHVDPKRFEAYREAEDGATEDPSMIGHYYDKLLHVACPPSEIVNNRYLEEKLKDSAKELVEVCLRYGKTGVVDEDYIRSFRVP